MAQNMESSSNVAMNVATGNAGMASAKPAIIVWRAGVTPVILNAGVLFANYFPVNTGIAIREEVMPVAM